MSHRIAKVNKHLQRIFGAVLLDEADIEPGVLVTISRVDVTKNLKSATVWLYIFPLEKAAATLASLTHQLYELQGAFNRALSMRPLPRLILRIDYGAAHAEAVEKTLKKITPHTE